MFGSERMYNTITRWLLTVTVLHSYTRDDLILYQLYLECHGSTYCTASNFVSYTVVDSKTFLWHHAHIPRTGKFLRNVSVLIAHARQNIRPQIVGIVIFRYWSSRISENQIRRNGGRIPNTLGDFPIQLSGNPRLKKEGTMETHEQQQC